MYKVEILYEIALDLIRLRIASVLRVLDLFVYIYIYIYIVCAGAHAVTYKGCEAEWWHMHAR